MPLIFDKIRSPPPKCRCKHGVSLPRSLQQAQESAGLKKGYHCDGTPGIQHRIFFPDSPFWSLSATAAGTLALRPSSWEETESQGKSQANPHGRALAEKKSKQVECFTHNPIDHRTCLLPLAPPEQQNKQTPNKSAPLLVFKDSNPTPPLAFPFLWEPLQLWQTAV